MCIIVEDMKQFSAMKETLSDIQNKYEELTTQTETQRKDNQSKQVSSNAVYSRLSLIEHRRNLFALSGIRISVTKY